MKSHRSAVARRVGIFHLALLYLLMDELQGQAHNTAHRPRSSLRDAPSAHIQHGSSPGSNGTIQLRSTHLRHTVAGGSIRRKPILQPDIQRDLTGPTEVCTQRKSPRPPSQRQRLDTAQPQCAQGMRDSAFGSSHRRLAGTQQHQHHPDSRSAGLARNALLPLVWGRERGDACAGTFFTCHPQA